VRHRPGYFAPARRVQAQSGTTDPENRAPVAR
jgi:hypothetical protein